MRARTACGSMGLAGVVASFVALLAGPAAGQATTRVSVDSGGVQGNDDSFTASISADGRYVAFSSAASNLDNSDAQHSLQAYAGSTRRFQHWFRDSMGGGALFNTSNAISILIEP